MKWKQVGRDAVILYLADEISDASLARSLTIASELEQRPPAGLKDFIPAYTSVFLQFDAHHNEPLDIWAKSLVAQLQKLEHAPLPDTAPIEIPVSYGGDDLKRVMETSRLSKEEVIALHTAPIYRIHMIGFTPGFAYLGGLDARIHTPRLAKPRLMVKAGSVGIGGAQTGIYTVNGPGGWNIIGHTETRIYDPLRENPFLLKQGDRLKFFPM